MPRLGARIADKVGFHDKTATTQRASASQAAVTNTAAAVATADGSDAGTTQTLANALKTELNKVITDNAAQTVLINELRTALVNKGIIKGAA